MRASLLALFVAVSACPAVAEPAPAKPAISASLERHFTSNALNQPLAMADWYTLLRGSLEKSWRIEGGIFRLGAEMQATQFDRTQIEDDRALGLLAEIHRAVAPGVELRGTLTYRVSSEGDDLLLGPVVIGTRTVKHALGGKAQLGIDLGDEVTVVLEAGNQFQKAGRTRFDHALLSSANLEPGRNVLELAAKLSRGFGAATLGVSAGAKRIAIEEIGFPPVALSLDEYTLRAEATARSETGAEFGLAFGVQWLRGAYGIFADARPTYHAAFTQPLPHGFEIRGSVFGRFETADSEDPLASWLNRAEFEASCQPTEWLKLGAGVFAEIKENLLLQNWERSRGVYGEASYQAGEAVSLVVRIDWSNHFASVIDVEKKSTGLLVGIRTKL